MRKIKKCEKFLNDTLLPKRIEAAYTTIAGGRNAKNMKNLKNFMCARLLPILYRSSTIENSKTSYDIYSQGLGSPVGVKYKHFTLNFSKGR